MLKVYKYEGKDREQLIKECLNETNTTIEHLYLSEQETEVGLFKSKKYTIEVIKKDDVIAFIKDFIKTVCGLMKVNVDMEIKEEEDYLSVALASDNNPILIGKEGRTLNSLQILLRQALKNNNSFNIKVNLDASNYRSKKSDRLEYEIKKIAKEVIRSKMEVKLDPMNSYERRIVHNVVSSFSELTSTSEGEEPNRYTVIRYKDKVGE
jgi:spoIIIJ-associated protein